MTENASTFDSVIQTWGYKLTIQRQTVLKIIIKNRDKHLSVEEIFEELKRSNFRVGLATVYRTIKLFEKIGFIQHIALDDGYLRYQIVDPGEKREHNHLICEICGDVIDIQNVIEIPKELLELFERKVFVEKGFTVTNQKVQFFGICKKCSEDFEIEKSNIPIAII